MSRLIDADKLLEELKMMLDEGFLANHCSNYNCDHESRCTFCYIKRAIFILKKQPTVFDCGDCDLDDFTEDLLTMGYTKGYNKGIDDLASLAIIKQHALFINPSVAEERHFKSYIDILAEQLKGGEINGSSNSGNP